MTREQRAALLRISAKQGAKGFSKLVQEAIDQYLERLEGQEASTKLAAALAAQGSISDEEGRQLQENVNAIRSNWR